MSTFSITSIDGKKCTAVRKAQVAVTTTSSSSSSSTSSSFSTSTSTTSAFTSIAVSTTFSTSSTSISTPAAATSTALPDTFLNAPDLNTPTSAVQEETSTTSFTSSQSAIPITTSIPGTAQISATSVPPSIPSSTSPALDNESSSITPTLDSTAASSSQTIDQGLSSTTQTNDSIAPAPTSDAPSSASNPTSQIIGAGGAATATTTGSGQLESSEAGPSLTNGAQNNSTGSAISTQTTVAVAGGVIGGLALISIIAFLLWFWRKRLMKKRRSTMLTPLSTGANYRGGEKGPYVISRNSLGPTTIPEKVRAMVGYNYHRLRGRVNSLVTRSPKPSVDMNRGNSQFGLPSTPLSRSTSRATAPSTEAMTTKDKFVDWWGRLTEDGNLNWKLRNGTPKGGRENNDTYTSMPSTAQARKKMTQPDFLTLLSMDEKQQQAVSNNTTGSSGNPRRSQSLGNEHFLGGLGLNFDVENPFSDANAMRHDSAKVMPLAVPRAAEVSNPFSDANAIPGPSRPPNNAMAGAPATYVQNMRRSRGYSVSAANARPPSGATTTTAGRGPSLYRESSLSVETSDTRRNKFRSDPFDLDRPELLAQSPGSSTRGVAGSSNNSSSGRYSGNTAQGLPNMPRPTHARGESFTSKYSSGVSSMGDWSDPGPDVGPAAGRWDTPSPDGALGRQPPLERGRGGGSQRSVGKAM